MRQFILTLLLLAVATAAGAGEIVNSIVAIVDEQAITLFEIEAMTAPLVAQLQQKSPNLPPEELQRKIAEIKQYILQNLIEQKLIESEVRRLGIDVTDQEIDDYINRVKQANNYTDDTLKMALMRQGLTMQEFRDRIKKEIMREQYVSFRMRDKLRVRDEDIQAYYDQHKDEFAAEPVVKIAEIRLNVPPEASEADIQTVFAKANQVYEKLLAGDDFAATARANSQGPTALDGGMLGEFKLDTELQPTYRKAVLPLQPGQVSTIYRDRNGFVIIKLLDKRASGALAFEAVKDKIEMQLRKKQADLEMDRLASELRKKSFVDIKKNFLQEKK